tara:strand:- start:245 stop:490 length:246 start_codon:yes stop_codon:yes gene_type:complete
VLGERDSTKKKRKKKRRQQRLYIDSFSQPLLLLPPLSSHSEAPPSTLSPFMSTPLCLKEQWGLIALKCIVNHLSQRMTMYD